MSVDPESVDPEIEERRLNDWSRRLTQALQILDLEVEPGMLIELGRKSEQTVSPDAGLVSAFMVGYAAGLTTTSGRKSAEEAVQKAANTAFQLAETGLDGPDQPGWKGSAQ